MEKEKVIIKTKYIIFNILGIITLVAILYGVVGFVVWNWNPSEWDPRLRFAFISLIFLVVSLVQSAILQLFLIMLKEDEETPDLYNNE